MTRRSQASSAAASPAVLYGVGVGPGDPELLTLRAMRLIREADIVFCPKGRHGPGRARQTVEAHLLGKRVVELDFEMTEDARAASRAAAQRVARELAAGATGVFITEGDPSLYSTFGPLRTQLSEVAPHLRTIAIPGVSSLNAAAAAAGVSLGQGDETLAVLPASVPAEVVKDALAVFDRVAVLKPSMRPELGRLLAGAGVLQGSVLVADASVAEESVTAGEVQGEARAPYFSTWLAPGARRKGGRVYFVGAGPGDASLLTRQAVSLLRHADLVVSADSLVMADVAAISGARAEVVGSAGMTLEEVMERMLTAARRGAVVVRLHSGDPSVYGALAEQLRLLRDEGVPYEIVPGVSSAFAAAAALGTELTQPGGAQTVIFTRHGTRVPTPERERLRELARTRSTLCIFLSVAAAREVQRELLAAGLSPETPAAIAYRVSWPDELVIRTTVGGLVDVVREHRLRRQALMLVGQALGAGEQRSHLYDPGHAHIHRRRRTARIPGIAGDLALVAVSRPGLDLAHRLRRAGAHPDVYAPHALAAPGDTAFDAAGTCVKALFRARRPLIVFMALGAAVRLLARELGDKATDPPVVVVDDAGAFAVSLLGGRSAHANRLAEWTAAVLGARLVVTTAAERLGLPAIDDALGARGWWVSSGRLARLEAAVVNGEQIGFYGPGLRPPRARQGRAPDSRPRWHRVRQLNADGTTPNGSTGLAVTDRELTTVPRDWVLVRPRRIVVGVGCAVAAEAGELWEAVQHCLEQAGLSREGVRIVATVDRRQRHDAVRALVERLQAELVLFTPAELAQVAVPNPSEQVRAALGTPSVAEAAALSVGGSRLITPKVIRGRVTVALAEVGATPRRSR